MSVNNRECLVVVRGADALAADGSFEYMDRFVWPGHLESNGAFRTGRREFESCSGRESGVPRKCHRNANSLVVSRVVSGEAPLHGAFAQHSDWSWESMVNGKDSNSTARETGFVDSDTGRVGEIECGLDPTSSSQGHSITAAERLPVSHSNCHGADGESGNRSVPEQFGRTRFVVVDELSVATTACIEECERCFLRYMSADWLGNGSWSVSQPTYESCCDPEHDGSEGDTQPQVN